MLASSQHDRRADGLVFGGADVEAAVQDARIARIVDVAVGRKRHREAIRIEQIVARIDHSRIIAHRTSFQTELTRRILDTSCVLREILETLRADAVGKRRGDSFDGRAVSSHVAVGVSRSGAPAITEQRTVEVRAAGIACPVYDRIAALPASAAVYCRRLPRAKAQGHAGRLR